MRSPDRMSGRRPIGQAVESRTLRVKRPVIGAVALSLMSVSLMSAACASTGGVPKPFPTPGPTSARRGDRATPPDGSDRATPSLPSAPDHDAVVATALNLRGVPYRDGGASPAGFDCSGFTQYVFAQHGVTLPRGVREQFRTGRHIKPKDLEPGDLIFFTTTDRSASHVGIAVGGDEFVHAPSSAGVVRVERLSSSYWSARVVGARRVDTD
jgi:cell wall-associated NlpC family hydrolase